MFELYTAGLKYFTNPLIYLVIFVGTLIGTIFGALPGLTASTTIAIFLSFTFGLDPVISFGLLLGLYQGAVYGGSISAIAINIPGTPGAIATGLDGYEMAKRGEAGKAIGIATIASVIGGLMSVIALAFFSPLVASVALKFSAQEFVGVALLGLSIIAFISPGSMTKGLIAGVLGLIIGIVGLDNISGYPRFVYGINDLTTGVSMVPVMIGLYGLSEMFVTISEKPAGEIVVQKIKDTVPKFKEVISLWATYLRCSVIGVIIGAIPAAGASIAALVAYGQEKRFSSEGDKMGTGIIRGVAAPEAANNASVGGALIPLLTLGIPGDAMTAVLMGALIINGLRPGPLLFTEQMPFVSSVFISLTLATLFMLPIGLFGARYIAKILNLPREYLVPGIMLLCLIGAFAIRDSFFDLYVLIFAGVIGFFLRKLEFSPAPIILGMMLGPIFESNLRRSMILSRGDWSTFVTRPISLLMLIITLLVLVGPGLYDFIKNKIVKA